MYDAHCRAREFLLQGLVMRLRPDRFGQYRFTGDYRPRLARLLLNMRD